MDIPKTVTRLEIIEDKGRVYTNWDKDNIIYASLQDNERTLKIFITNPNNA